MPNKKKKNKKPWYKRIRKLWGFNPKTRYKKGNKKIRRRNKSKTKKELKEKCDG